MEQAKRYAASHQTSVSQLVEQYFKSLSPAPRKKNILELMKELPKPKRKVPEGDLRKLYYESRRKKYGF
jgi:hypothetical protein